MGVPAESTTRSNRSVVSGKAAAGAEGRCEGDAIRIQVESVDLDTPAEQSQAHEQALGPDSDDQGRGWDLGRQASQGRLHDGQRLDADEVRRRLDRGLPGERARHDQLLGKSPGAIHPDRQPLDAARRTSTEALVAAKTRDVRLDDDALTDTFERDALADGLDPTERLMAQGPGKARCGPVASEDAHVGAAQSDAADGDEHIVRTR